MADTRALFSHRFEAARSAWTDGDEPAAAEALRSAIIAARNDPTLRRELASALYNLGRLSRKLGPVGATEAAPLLTEALAISEELFGREDAALSPLLLELSRLYLQQSQHARAEDALERLLAIARAKGDEHPDVASALADLAFVKRKLGDDASAEVLYRDALRIREKTLEPNHMAIVGTLERLSETCAARGNFTEALALLRRALPAREAALGSGHERVRAARARVTEFELQIANSTTATTAATRPAAPPLKRAPESPADTPSTPATPSINSKGLEFLGESRLPVVAPSSRPRERGKTPAVAAAVAAASLIVSAPTPAAPQIAISALKGAGTPGTIAGRESGAVYRHLIRAEVGNAGASQPDTASNNATLRSSRSIVAPVETGSSQPTRKKGTRLYATAGVATLAIALAGMLMLRPRAAGGRGPAPISAETSALRRASTVDAPVVTTPSKTVSTAAAAAAMVAVTRAESPSTASATSSAAPVQREPSGQKSAPELRAPRVNIHLDSVDLPSMPATLSGDAILRSAIERQRAADSDRAAAKAAVTTPTSADAENAHTSPKLIGRAPDPGFPDALLRSGRREGQVLVRFIVTDLGRVDVSSLVVERSDHELFTDAVREVLPLFRFEPAHTLGPESKPVAVWVSVPFRFTTKKR